VDFLGPADRSDRRPRELLTRKDKNRDICSRKLGKVVRLLIFKSVPGRCKGQRRDSDMDNAN
jgi:hypothetical protein